MTEADWSGSVDPEAMLEFCRRRAGTRKLRLFVCACCRRVWEYASEVAQAGVEFAERYADKKFTRERMTTDDAVEVRQTINLDHRLRPARKCSVLRAVDVALFQITTERAQEAALWTARAEADDAEASPVSSLLLAERRAQAALIRDIFGGLVSGVLFSSEWRTSTSVSLARQMYESREFSAMPILADALQDAGCEDEDILSHCRGLGPHVRGCWVVDLVLGKE
ncbi:Uncharacterized protein OS=Sorangium cellulosum (strain So ce56) GN=sce5710 PE=4 SV=1 [Gemmataceae bacterium]|nr:Uncharacterized protein OS=Sorangium cellulosum (strain So ce56) GN=sce5710 PE=4 SV=1 [Gemmataceae bacterium]VTU01832.1 Uncharacterized protein OS=Sorangium cellulosum (strain So ce56) GN=sce5710 PE=4 SV=1 [Gemmataceae bacterium]